MRERLDAWLFAVLVLAGAACVAYLSTRFDASVDLTAGARASLAPASRAVLAQLKGPVQITSYASPGSGLRPSIARFIARYQRFKSDLSLRFVDPERDPAAMRKAGITLDGEIIMTYQGREQRLDELSERSFSNALEQLARGGERLLAFVTGDGERDPSGKANADLGTFMTQLEARGMRAVPLDFTRAAAVPEHTDLVVLASPQAPLSDGAVGALVDYLDRGGNLLWLTEPETGDVGLAPLARALGVRRMPGVIVDAAGAAYGLDDSRFVAVNHYPAQDITRGFALTTLFPQAAALAQVNGAPWKLSPILRSSDTSWSETGPMPGAGEASAKVRFDADAGELHGPLDFGFALTRLSPSPDKGQQRTVVLGDGDFLSNSYLGNAGNRAFGERVIDWLLGDDALIDMPARGAPDRSLTLSQGALDALAIGFLIGLPLLLLVIGATLSWRRRRR